MCTKHEIQIFQALFSLLLSFIISDCRNPRKKNRFAVFIFYIIKLFFAKANLSRGERAIATFSSPNFAWHRYVRWSTPPTSQFIASSISRLMSKCKAVRSLSSLPQTKYKKKKHCTSFHGSHTPRQDTFVCILHVAKKSCCRMGSTETRRINLLTWNDKEGEKKLLDNRFMRDKSA